MLCGPLQRGTCVHGVPHESPGVALALEVALVALALEVALQEIGELEELEVV
jgi:hypothetical protein